MNVTVLGAGTMGHGIAQVTAMAGHDVTIRDIEESILEDGVEAIERNLQGGVERDKLTQAEADAALDRIDTTTDLAGAVTDAAFVIEAVPEDLDLKRDTFTDVEEHVTDDTIIASNTSSLSMTAIADALEHPERAVGLHFFNPVHIMGLVEIIVAEQTSEDTLAAATDLVEEIDKEPVTVTDTAGFASSRLGVALGVEAIRMLEEGVASAEDIDQAMELGYNHPMGPLELTDVVGLDVRLDILEYLREELGERFKPPQTLKRKVRAGKLGKKSGEGFYVWEDGEIVGVSGDDDR
ncbi:3-hydroxyacyl-CoA dehydrogenase [Halopenitus malekzadehii]|uniref:3-hydroxyacyl-CoA dehydrogenase n=1 Tax=Halopenitus malekzadehii TaxID=1267564 RepID=A0A1H6IV53_9EURY|nr:3-hydroxyacyl-CoA dehydrogenase family protein [Halopenitus malekzadehii]SEH51568.1 3-hydroxyacyl-CoA dehydrogenase [Halopenitus malekzadehii]